MNAVNDEVCRYIGIMISIENRTGKKIDDADLDKAWESSLDLANDGLPRTFTMPCGNSMSIASVGKNGRVNVPCPCGDPNHMFVEYRFWRTHEPGPNS